MSEDKDDKMIDEDGVIYEKGWNGEYRPKEGFFGPEQDKDWFGRPNLEKDFWGRPEEERDFWGNSTKSSDGRTLYRRSQNHSSGSSSSSGGSDSTGLVMLFLAPVLGIIILGITFGIPFAIFWVVYNALLHFFNVILAIVLGTTYCLFFCVLDVLLINHLYSELKTDWEGRFTIAYMVLLLIVPWATGKIVISSIKTENLAAQPLFSIKEPLSSITPETIIIYGKISSEVSVVNLRKSPGYQNKNSNDVIVTIPTGAEVEIIGESKFTDNLTWWYVSWNGYEGWLADHTGSGKTILVFK